MSDYYLLKKIKEQNRRKNYELLEKIKVDIRADKEQERIRRKIRESISSHTLDLDDILDKYQVIITDRSEDFPFIYSKDLTEVNRITRDLPTRMDKARAIFGWFEENINYSKSGDVGYRNSEEVYCQKQGICGEMSYLYITLARSAGMQAEMAYVDRDAYGKEVHHACAWVSVEGGDILVDPAYHAFGIRHESYRTLSDREVTELFRDWRYCHA